jgi:hypothetical protein
MQLWDANPRHFRQIERPLFLPPLAGAPNRVSNHSLIRQRTIRPTSSPANTSSFSSSNSYGHQTPCHKYIQTRYTPPLTPPPSITSKVSGPTSIPNMCPADSNTDKYYTLNRLFSDIRKGIVDRPVETQLCAEDIPRPGGGMSGGFTSNQWAVASYGIRLGGNIWPTDA